MAVTVKAGPTTDIVSSLRLRRRGAHDVLTIWNRGGLCGELVLTAGDGEVIAHRLSASLGETVSAALALHDRMDARRALHDGARRLEAISDAFYKLVPDIPPDTRAALELETLIGDARALMAQAARGSAPPPDPEREAQRSLDRIAKLRSEG
jgi:hypothetical protein